MPQWLQIKDRRESLADAKPQFFILRLPHARHDTPPDFTRQAGNSRKYASNDGNLFQMEYSLNRTPAINVATTTIKAGTTKRSIS
jgi:hypothetical protein